LYSRINQNGWLPGGGIMPGIIHDNAGVIAQEISGLVLVNIISQVQGILQKQEATGLADLQNSRTLGQLESLTDQQAEILARSMVPEIQPEISNLVEYSI